MSFDRIKNKTQRVLEKQNVKEKNQVDDRGEGNRTQTGLWGM